MRGVSSATGAKVRPRERTTRPPDGADVVKWAVMTIRVFLLDDHEIVRTGLRSLLESTDELEVVGEAGTVAEALARIPALRPDVAILDVRLPDGSGVEVCRDIRAQMPTTACIMLTSYADDEALFASIMAGSVSYTHLTLPTIYSV